MAAGQPRSEAVIIAQLVNAATLFFDRQVLDSTLAAVADKNPASLTKIGAIVPPTGNLAADLATCGRFQFPADG